jgi:hypothetical protein
MNDVMIVFSEFGKQQHMLMALAMICRVVFHGCMRDRWQNFVRDAMIVSHGGVGVCDW